MRAGHVRESGDILLTEQIEPWSWHVLLLPAPDVEKAPEGAWFTPEGGGDERIRTAE